MKAKRICFLGYNEPDGKEFGNGVAKVIYNLASLLKERGHEISYYHLFSKEEYRKLNRFLQDNKIDVALWHMTTLKVKKHLHTPCPLICLWHSTPFFSRNLAHGLFNMTMFTYITACANKMVLLSDKFIPKFFPAKLFPKKVTAIHNFLLTKNVVVDIANKKNEVLYVGRLDNNQKRVDLLLKVWRKIEDTITDWTLIICGKGTDEMTLKQMVKDFGLQNVRFEGFVSEPSLYYKSASIICLTSAIEGMPMVLEEAASFGCVPMAFDSFDSASDLILDRENGRLIQAFNVDTYACALKELIQDDLLRTRLACNAQSDSSRFDPEMIIDKWERLFEEVKCNK